MEQRGKRSVAQLEVIFLGNKQEESVHDPGLRLLRVEVQQRGECGYGSWAGKAADPRQHTRPAGATTIQHRAS